MLGTDVCVAKLNLSCARRQKKLFCAIQGMVQIFAETAPALN
jgi:hypothetical protein